MIQRIQTVYLLVVVLLECFMLFMPWVEYASGDFVQTFSLLKDQKGEDGTSHISVLPLTICVFLNLAFTLYAIAGFKDRKKQIRVAWWNIFMMMGSLGVFAFLHYQAIQSINEIEEPTMAYKITVALPLIAAVFLWLALKAIRKDEELVRSADRLR